MYKYAILGFIFIAGIACNQQLRAQTVCISQEAANKCSQLADQYKAALATIEAFKIERTASQAAIDSRDTLIARLKDVIAISDQKDAAQAKYNALRDAIDKLQTDLIALQQKQLAKKGSTGFAKFLKALQVIYYGVSIALLL